MPQLDGDYQETWNGVAVCSTELNNAVNVLLICTLSIQSIARSAQTAELDAISSVPAGHMDKAFQQC